MKEGGFVGGNCAVVFGVCFLKEGLWWLLVAFWWFLVVYGGFDAFCWFLVVFCFFGVVSGMVLTILGCFVMVFLALCWYFKTSQKHSLAAQKWCMVSKVGFCIARDSRPL